jgi:hypothetical protein
MPLEGHYERQTTPMYKLSSRETKTAWAVLAVTLAAMLAVILLTVGDSNPPTARGCISVPVAGIVGSEMISGCGRVAEAKCAHYAQFESTRAETIVAECKTQGVPLTGDPNDRSLIRRRG